MNYHDKLKRLVGGTLEPDDFSHLGHVGVAYEALARHNFGIAEFIADVLAAACKLDCERRERGKFQFKSVLRELRMDQTAFAPILDSSPRQMRAIFCRCANQMRMARMAAVRAQRNSSSAQSAKGRTAEA